MTPIYAAAIVLLFIALGELISMWSKARVPSLLVAMLGIFLVAKAGWIPGSVVEDSTLLQVYLILQGPILFHMGSLIPLHTLRKQWRSVIIAIAGMLVAVGLLFAVVMPLFGFQTVVAGSGPLAGGIVATGLTTEGLTKAGVASTIVVLPALVLMLQSVPAMPMTNFLLRRFALRLRDSGELETMAAAAAKAEEQQAERKKLVNLPESLVENQLFILFLVLVGGSLANFLGGITHIPSSIVALVLGIVSTYFGFTPERTLEKANGFGIAMAAVIAVVMAPMIKASMSDVIAAFVPVVTILLIGGAGIMLGGFVATKLLKWRPTLGMSVALTAMYGFPADYLLTSEVARATGRTAEERKALLDVMLPPMLVGGFTSVSAGSVAIASILVSFL